MVDQWTIRDNGGNWEGSFPARATRKRSAPEGEHAMLQEILRTAPSPIAREFLLHYYISAKSWPLVLLVGQPGAALQQFFYLLAGGIAGCSDGQIRLLPARFPGQADAGNARYFDTLQGRFSTMAFLDLQTEAAMPGNEGRAYFLCLDQADPQELDGYTHLYLNPNGQDQSPLPLSPNLHLTAIVCVEGGAWYLPPVLLNQAGIVEVTVPWGGGNPDQVSFCPPVGWQRLFLRSTIRDPDQARHKLHSLGLLDMLQDTLAALQPYLPIEITPDRRAGLLLYVANSFSLDGESLSDRTAEDGLYHAVDIQLGQLLLPCMEQRLSWDSKRWELLIGQLKGSFPQAHARARRLLLAHTLIADASANAQGAVQK